MTPLSIGNYRRMIKNDVGRVKKPSLNLKEQNKNAADGSFILRIEVCRETSGDSAVSQIL